MVASRSSLIWLVALLATSTLQAADEAGVVAKGSASIRGGDVDSARQEALQAAFREALSKCGRVGQDAGGLAKLGGSELSAMVERYVALSEENSNGTLNLEVKVFPKDAPAPSSADGQSKLGQQLRSTGNPRAYLIEDVTLASRSDDVGTKLLRLVADGLLSKGFPVIDPMRKREVTKGSVSSHDVDGIRAISAEVKKTVDAEILIVVEATDVAAEKNEFGMFSGRGTVSLRAVYTDSDQLAATGSDAGKSLDQSEEAAMQKALSQAAKGATEKLAAAVTEAWSRQATQGRDITLTIELADFSKLGWLRKQIEKLPGVNAATQRSYDAGVAKVNITFAGVPQQLSERIQKADLEPLKVDVLETSQNEVKIRAK